MEFRRILFIFLGVFVLTLCVRSLFKYHASLRMERRFAAMVAENHGDQNATQPLHNALLSALMERQFAELRERPKKYPSFILYTRTMKCGGRSLMNVIDKLSVRNGFFTNSHQSGGFRPPLDTLIDDVKYFASLGWPRITGTHIHFINFQKFGLPQPVMINMIRDPIERFVSLYYWKIYGDGMPLHNRSPDGRVIDINQCILSGNRKCRLEQVSFRLGVYFCGQGSSICNTGSPESVAIAKRHIDENYLFVGITEEFDNTLKILEKILPDYFTGAMDVWQGLKEGSLQVTATKTKGELTPESRERLQKMMVYDYEIYNYVKEKFNKHKRDLRIEME